MLYKLICFIYIHLWQSTLDAVDRLPVCTVVGASLRGGLFVLCRSVGVLCETRRPLRKSGLEALLNAVPRTVWLCSRILWRFSCLFRMLPFLVTCIVSLDPLGLLWINIYINFCLVVSMFYWWRNCVKVEINIFVFGTSHCQSFPY